MLTFVLAFSSLRVDYLYAGETTMAEPPSKAASAVESPSAEGLPAAAGENTQTESDDGSQAVAPEPKGESAGKASSVPSEDEAQVLDTADKPRAEQPADAPEAVSPEAGRAPAPLPAPEAVSPFSLEGPSPSGSLLTASGETSDAAFLAACSSGEAKLSLALEASGARFEAARAALQARYSGDLTFEVWDMQLKAGGADLPLPEGSSVGLKFMRYVDGYGMPGFAGLGESPQVLPARRRRLPHRGGPRRERPLPRCRVHGRVLLRRARDPRRPQRRQPERDSQHDVGSGQLQHHSESVCGCRGRAHRGESLYDHREVPASRA